MLDYLNIRRFAIIDATELELDTGLTALTGETGAGKSILLDALGQVLGDRAATDSVPSGEARAEISASFSIVNLPGVRRWLAERDLDDHDDCLLRRVITRDSSSRASINGAPVAIAQLRELGAQLVSLHGQHAHQTLARPADQRQLLDRFARPAALASVAKAFERWQYAHSAWLAASTNVRARQERIDLLNFQLREFDQLDIGGLPVSDIEAEHRWLANADELSSLGQQSLAALEDSSGAAGACAIGALTRCVKPLQALVALDERLREALDLVESATIQSSEAASLLRNHVSALERDDTRLAWLDDQLAALHRLARKHQVSMSALSATEQALRDELESLESPAASIDALERQLAEARDHFEQAARTLGNARRKAARALARTITGSMQTLGMKDGSLSIDVTTDSEAVTRHGKETITFLVSPNPGVAAMPLGKIASGGELSRISLCIQLATIESQPVPTLIFDEVDAGIGGAVAETVGQLLRRVGQHSQVLCVTHLPQVAAQAHQQLQVSKTVIKGQTQTTLQALDDNGRREEVARMLGGARLTQKSRQHAQEMLDAARESDAVAG